MMVDAEYVLMFREEKMISSAKNNKKSGNFLSRLLVSKVL